jgi:hypothetical protein
MHFPNWADWIVLIFLAFAAPLIAAGMQSLYAVWFCGERGYQALVGGPYFGYVEKPGLTTLLFVFHICSIVGTLTFLVLLPFRKRPLLYWRIWIGGIAILTCYFITIQKDVIIK